MYLHFSNLKSKNRRFKNILPFTFFKIILLIKSLIILQSTRFTLKNILDNSDFIYEKR
jgi:hypothetical protein